ncbi:phosphatase PAP2 family protein [Micromonospora yasonensis]|uniref:phosphatase PAP2 family protein n=1 Tax=Micromonospora yasonensis TaxID=1128667 RepID=UPI002231670F|nr:phosphatase PAP2 family protein [Micromonospora yasonensis]MCW3840882.1 phosphatase PAP2 family protein [Micromonospora yasonensis]
MAVVTDPQPPARTGATPSPDGGRRRVVAMAIWGVAFVAAWLAIGLPTDPAYAFVWIWAGTIAWHSARPWRSHLRFARDWIPVVLLLAGYNLSRGFADNGATPHAMELIVADRFMLGWATGGEVPTIWLQQHLYRPDQVHWWDVLVSWIYFSHFVATLAAAAVLWLRDRSRWAAYMRRWGFLCAAGLVTYFLYPAAPPWWAAQNGLLTEVARISTRGWKEIGMHGAGNLLNAGQIASNPVAAMPSLHTAFALFVVLFFLRSVRKRWWPLLLAYPLAMTFTLIYSGEHYLIDVLVGWAYVGMTYLVVGLVERWWAAYRARRGTPPAPLVAADADPPPPPRTDTAPAATIPADR